MRYRNQIRDPRPGRPNADEIKKTTESLQKSQTKIPSEYQKEGREKQPPPGRH